MPKKTQFTQEQLTELFAFYTTHSQKATLEKFHIRLSRLNELLVEHNIDKHNNGKTFGQAHRKTIIDEQEVLNYYAEHTFGATYSKFHIKPTRLEALLNKYGISRHSKEQTKKFADADKLKTIQTKQLANTVQVQAVIQYYKNHSDSATILAHHISKKHLLLILAANNIPQHTHEENYQFATAEICKTKARNKSFNISKAEDCYYLQLCEQYGKENILRQYKDPRYPFNCDFYVKSQDLFIEFNKHWTHGPHPFDAQNNNDIALLKIWQERASKSQYYRSAIDVWTRRDPQKQQIAIINNLNYQIIY